MKRTNSLWTSRIFILAFLVLTFFCWCPILYASYGPAERIWTFLATGIIRGENMILSPQPFLLNLNGFLASFIVAGIVFVGVSLMTQLGPVEKKSLALFFHPALEE